MAAIFFSAEKITRLEAENRHLLSVTQSAANERVTDLENQVDDLARLKDAFEKVRRGALTRSQRQTSGNPYLDNYVFKSPPAR